MSGDEERLDAQLRAPAAARRAPGIRVARDGASRRARGPAGRENLRAQFELRRELLRRRLRARPGPMA